MSEAVRPAIGHKKHIASVEYFAGVGHGQRGDELREAAAFIAAQNAEIEQLRSALLWALGRGRDYFPARQKDDGPPGGDADSLWRASAFLRSRT